MGDYTTYSVPSNIKELITYDFLYTLRGQLFRICGQYDLKSFAEEGIPTRTAGIEWDSAFCKACLLTNNTELLNHYLQLSWFKQEIFNEEIYNLMIEKHLILGNLNITNILKQKLGILPDKICVCCDCGGWYTKDMVLELSDEESAHEITKYRCLHCDDILQSKSKHNCGTDYYYKCFEELKEYENK